MPKHQRNATDDMTAEQKRDPENPRNFSYEKIIALSQDWPVPLSSETRKAEIRECKYRLERIWLNKAEDGMNVFMEHRTKWRERQALFEGGTPVSAIARMYRIPKSVIARRAKVYHWKVPLNTAAEIHTERGLPCSAPISLVTPQEEQELPLSTQELMRERRLMNMAAAQWDAVPFRDQKEALRMRIHKLARRALGWMEELTDEQLAQIDTVKMLKELAAVTEKVAPIEVEQQPQRPGSMLHISVMNGETGLPPRVRGRVIEDAG